MKKLNKKLNVKESNTVEMYFSCTRNCDKSCNSGYEYQQNSDNDYYISYGESVEHNWG